ncbi:MAG: leucine-rich repeat domain-containing protein [Candidatus Absconditabacteria bacterium]|nr:leucine-rich repeat domain-containing protein [Candidatus Absconditabacteria bacterium]
MKKIFSAGIIIIGLLSSFTFAVELNSTNITQAPYNCATSATSCNLSNKSPKITSIAPGTFTNHSSLTTLYFGYNQITSIESGDFSGLSSLTELGLNSNQITSIESESFSGLSSLTYLHLDSNQITSIESGDFSGLSSLTYLSLNSNQITSIERESFSGLSSLTRLFLNSNQIISIESESFSELSSLTELYLDSNQITSIESGDFSGLSSLTRLYLNFNPIYHIDNNAFDNLLILQYLYINNVCTTTPITIYFGNNKETDTDNNFCSIVDTDNSGDFIDGLNNRSYNPGGGLLNLDGSYYIGSSPISFLPGVTNEILAKTVMKSENTNGYNQDYYQNTVEVQFDNGTLLTSNGQSFTGLLQGPLLITTGAVKGLDNVVALTKFGDSTKSINFSLPVTVRMPALGKNINDTVKIYYAQNLSDYWTFHTTATAIDINGVPYVEFTTDHATYFAIGEEIGSFVINNDDSTTASQNVTLTISASGSQYMRFSNISGSNRSDWESYSGSKSWLLSEGYGEKTVYAEFDIDEDYSADASTFDDIEYTNLLPGQTEGNISLNITGGVTECIYGTSLDMNAQDVKIGIPYTFSGTFPSAWYCQDYQGIDGGWTLTIQTTDLTNEKGNTISGSNLLISHDPVVVQGDLACTGNNGTPTQFYSAPYEIFAKASESNKICKVSTNDVSLLVNVPANQAPGSYSGTLTLTMNGF